MQGLLNVWQHYRYLLYKLIYTSLTIQFKKSFLGTTWLFVQPVITVVAWVLLQGAGLFDPGTTGVPYPAYVLLSTTIWSLFVSLYQLASHMLVGNAQVLLQHQFPREVYILEKMAVAIVNFMIPLLLSLLVLVIYGVSFSWHLLLFPLALLPLVLFGTAIGIVFALLKAITSDLHNFFDKAIVLIMYITPVVYANDPGSELLSSIIRWNPLTYLISFPRDLLIYGTFFQPVIFGGVALGSLLLFLLVLRYFRYAQPKVMERMMA